MSLVRPLQNEEVGHFIPLQELLEPESYLSRRLAGEYLLRLCETQEALSARPLVVQLDDGTTSVQHFTINLGTYENR